MSYEYQKERPYLFTEQGQLDFLKVRDAAHELLKIAGAFRQSEVLSRSGITGNSWQMVACVDRLVELGEVEVVPRDCWGQFTVYASKQRSNR